MRLLWLLTASWVFFCSPPGYGQDNVLPPGSLPAAVIPAMPLTLNQNCMAHVQNQGGPVNPDGSFVIPNVPIIPTFSVVSFVCQLANGNYVTGNSETFNLTPNALYRTQQTNLGAPSVSPVSLQLTAPNANIQGGVLTLTALGTLTGLHVTGILQDGSPVDLTNSQFGTFYLSSNPKVAVVDGGGRVTGVSTGSAIISAFNHGAAATLNISVYPPQPASGTGTVTGQVTLSNGTPAPGFLQVFLLRTNPVGLVGTSFMSGVTNPSGAYTFSSVPIGVTFVVQAGGIATSPNQMLTTSGQILNVNLTIPPQGTVNVQVFKSDGTPYPNVGISAADSGHTGLIFAGTTNATGTLTLPGVYGTFGVLAMDPSLPVTPGGGSEGQFVGSAGGAIPAPGATVNVTINAPISGTIQGTIYAGDGQTPISGADVTVFDGPIYGALSENVALAELATVLSDANGHYQFSNFRTGTQGFKVVASYNSVNAASTGLITSPGQSLAVNVVMPLQVVQGTVTFADGTPVSTPNVFASNLNCCSSNNFSTRFVSIPTSANGAYTIFLPSPLSVGGFIAPYYLTAQDAESGLSSAQLVSVTNPAAQQTLNIALPPSGTVTGTITINGTTTPYQNAVVAITENNPFFGGRQMQTGSDGVYSFDHVPLGQFSVQASNEFENAFASAAGAMTANDSTVTVNLTQNVSPNAGSVSGTVLNTDGITPIPNAQVLLENVDSSGPLSHFRTGATTDASGFYQSAGNLPLGDIRVSVASPTNPNVGGLGTGIVTAGNNTTVNVTLGNAYQFGRSFNLAGPDGFQYAVGCDGTLTAQPTSGIYEGGGGFSLTIDGLLDTFPCLGAGSLEAGGRQIVLGPATLGNVSVTRRIFSPATGGFVRYLEYLANPGTAPITVHVEVDAQEASRDATTVLVAPSSTNNTYAVTDAVGQTQAACVPPTSVICSVPLGFAFGGPGARRPATNITFLPGLNDLDYSALAAANLLDSELAIVNSVSYVWDVPIPPGGTAILMHFFLLRGLFDDAGAQAEAQALVSLTDPNALVGMTAADHANVVNFNVP